MKKAVTSNAEVYTIKHDVPMPDAAKGNRFGRVPKYPFAAMEVGDSFTTPTGDDPIQRSRTLFSAAHSWGSRQAPKRKFSVRRIYDMNEVGVWGIE